MSRNGTGRSRAAAAAPAPVKLKLDLHDELPPAADAFPGQAWGSPIRTANSAFGASVLSSAGQSTGSFSFTGEQRSARGRLLQPSTELDVLKCILLRETYITRLTAMTDALRKQQQLHSKRRSQTAVVAPTAALPSALLDLLDLLRVASVDVIEAITLWRLAQQNPYPTPTFMWNGANYLLKMKSDTDFLAACKPLRAWLGFSVLQNPFLIPHDIDISSSNGEAASYDATFEHDARAETVELGRHAWTGAVPVPDYRTVQPKVAAAAKKHAYATAVINDASLTQTAADKKLLLMTAKLKKQRAAASAAPASVNTHNIAPNLLSYTDLSRIRQCEYVLQCEDGESSFETEDSVTSESNGFQRSSERWSVDKLSDVSGIDHSKNNRSVFEHNFVTDTEQSQQELAHSSAKQRERDTIASLAKTLAALSDKTDSKRTSGNNKHFSNHNSLV
jgi:hypothetical protein